MNTIVETPSHHIDYNITDAALAELRERYRSVPDVETKEGYKEASSALSTLRKYRTDVEKKRKELKADALEYGRAVDAEAKRITAALESVEEPIRLAKDEYDTRKKREEEARIKAIRERIGRFSATTWEMSGKQLAEIKEALEAIKRQEIDEAFYGDFLGEANAAKGSAIARLNILIDTEETRIKQEEANRIERERLEKERAELDALRKAEAEQRRKEQEAIQAERRELERLKREEEKRVAQERADLERHRKEQEAIEEAARSTAESITHHETSFDAPRAPEATKRFVFHLSIVGDEFHCETFLGSLVTKDKAELMLLIEGAIGEVMTCAE